FKIDGNLATAGNFPGMTFQGGGGAYNTTTALYDGYTSGSNIYDKLSFQGLSEGWHMIQLRVTGTKNVSSSAFTLLANGFYIINGVMSDDVFNQGRLITGGNVMLNGAKDLRLLDSYNDDNIENPVNIDSMGGTLITASTILWTNINTFGTVETHGGDLEITAFVHAYTNAGQGPVGRLRVDGVEYEVTFGYSAANAEPAVGITTVLVPCLPGRHFVRF